MAGIKGIDVSHWQGTIDWDKVKAAGIKFAIIKAGGSDAGFYTDSKWEANYMGAKSAGIPIGAYYFVGKDCVTATAGKADAERFIKILKGKQLEYHAGCCLQCGGPIKQQTKRKPRRFCSDECRVKWWNDHRFLKQHKNMRMVKCAGCGVAFPVYGKQEKKYCSHECYIRSRFGGGKA